MQGRTNTTLQQHILCRRGKHANRHRSDQQELGEGTIGWLLSLEEAFFMTYALACLAVTGGAGPLSCQVQRSQALMSSAPFSLPLLLISAVFTPGC